MSVVRYQVVGDLATVRTVRNPFGDGRKRAVQLARNAFVPDDVDEKEIQHLLSVKLIAPVEAA